MDRRVRKTRALIIETFMTLLADKGFEKITINDIADRADINRGTVYLHFTDKYNLLDQCIDNYVEALISHCGDSQELKLNPKAMQLVFDYLQDNIGVYRLLLVNEGSGRFRKKLYQTINQMVKEVMREKSGIENEVSHHFLTAGFIGVLEWWIVDACHDDNQLVSSDRVKTDLLMMLSPYTQHLL